MQVRRSDPGLLLAQDRPSNGSDSGYLRTSLRGSRQRPHSRPEAPSRIESFIRSSARPVAHTAPQGVTTAETLVLAG